MLTSSTHAEPVADRLVLCYHAVDPDWPSELAVHPRALERQIEAVLARGYRATTFTDLVTGPPSERPTLAITFDDGYGSVAIHAAPILARLGVVGTVFVPSAFMGRDTPMRWSGIDQWSDRQWHASLRSLTWTQLRELADSGWEIGSHARTHPMLTVTDDDELSSELDGSKSEIERQLGRSCESIAYPYGDVDPRVISAARRAGYVAGAGLHGVDAEPDRLNWPRASIYPVDRRLRFTLKISRRARRLRSRLDTDRPARISH